MISRETLTRFEKAVEHMREVHQRAVLLNMAAFANYDRLEREGWFDDRIHLKASKLSTKSTEVLSKAIDCLDTLTSVREETQSPDGLELVTKACFRRLEKYISEMEIIERELAVVYPEHVRADLEDWIFKFHAECLRADIERSLARIDYLKANVSEDHVSEDHVSEAHVSEDEI